MTRAAQGAAAPKKVIFIGGTSYSGSTMLDLMLGNAADGFSCGEMGALFHPFRAYQLHPRCGCGEAGCGVWGEVKAAGAAGAYRRIFELFPAVNFIVDSTKNPLWIHSRTRELQRAGIGVRQVLVWKTPEEFKASRAKRGRSRGAGRAWVNYHKAYCSLVEDWRAVRYADLVASPRTLGALCGCLGIPWFDGKERYWEKTHHAVFGNASARIHLYDRESERFESCGSVMERNTRGEVTARGMAYRVIDDAAARRGGTLDLAQYTGAERRILEQLLLRDIRHGAAAGGAQAPWRTLFWRGALTLKRAAGTLGAYARG